MRIAIGGDISIKSAYEKFLKRKTGVLFNNVIEVLKKF